MSMERLQRLLGMLGLARFLWNFLLHQPECVGLKVQLERLQWMLSMRRLPSHSICRLAIGTVIGDFWTTVPRLVPVQHEWLDRQMQLERLLRMRRMCSDTQRMCAVLRGKEQPVVSQVQLGRLRCLRAVFGAPPRPTVRGGHQMRHQF